MWLKSVLAIASGAGLGALTRWGLGLGLNALFPAIPPGTLAANLIGAWLIGVAMAVFATDTSLAPEWRLFVITGFLGALTTFSTFSAEVTHLLQQQRLWLAGGAIALHVLGSLAMTLFGMTSATLFKRAVGG